MYFIFDCNGAIVGNPKGYKTYKGAARQSRFNLKIVQTIYRHFEERENRDNRCIYSIEWSA